MRKWICSIACIMALNLIYSQSDSVTMIRVNFLYGSRPKHKFKETEVKYFGGLHGGHVSVQAGDTDYGFGPTVMPVHIFAKRLRKSVFEARALDGQPRYSDGNKTVTLIIPLSQLQFRALDSIHNAYCRTSPYDYAFFGMRCAAATQDVLAGAGIIERRSRFWTIVSTFYPKKLRKRLIKIAKARGYQVIRSEGKTTRRWEKD